MTHSVSGEHIPKGFVLLMAALMALVAISIDAMLPALGVIGTELGVAHPNQAQYIVSLIFAGMALGQLICGPLSDAIGRKPVLYGTIALYLLGSVICLSAADMQVMLIGRFIQGLGVAGPNVIALSVVRDRYSGRTMARVMSLVMMVFIMGPVVAPALGQSLMLMSSWHAVFVMYIVYACLLLACIHWRLPETLAPEDIIPFRMGAIYRGVCTVLNNRRTVCYTICMGCMFGALVGDLNSAQQIFQVQYGVGEMFAFYFGLQALAFGISSLVNAHWVERYGMRYICWRAMLAIIVGSLAFLALHACVEAIAFWQFFLFGTFMLFCVGMLFGNLNALAMEPMGHLAGLAAAIIGSISLLISIIFGTIIGQLYDGTLIPLTAGFCLLGLIAMIFMRLGNRAGADT